MPVRATPADATAKWLQGLGGASDRMTRGAMAVTTAPGQKAAAAADKWLARVTQAKAKFANNVGRVSLAEWQNAYTKIGVPRVMQGAQAKQAKMTSFMNDFLPYLSAGVAKIDAMPKVTLEDGINRATAMIRHNAGFVRGKS